MAGSLTNPGRHPVGKASRGNKGFGHTRERVSTCKVCRAGVYHDEDWAFYRKPTGISHVSCVDGAR